MSKLDLLILCLGDSLTFGSRDEYHRSYPAELSRLFYEEDDANVFCINSSVPGETSSQLLKRLSTLNVPILDKSQHADRCLILIGSNDVQIKLPPDVFYDNLRQIVLFVNFYYKINNRHILIGKIPPICGPGLLTYPRNSNAQRKELNEQIEKFSFKESVPIVDFESMKNYIIDTVHYDNDGYIEMAKIWKRELLK